MLIAVDHGNKQIKTVHTPPFTSGLIQSDTPGFGTDALAYCAMIVSMHQRCCSTTALRCVIVNPFFIFSTTSFPSFKCIVLRLRPQFP